MKKIISIIFTVLIAVSVFAEDLFKGKKFIEMYNRDSRYEFFDDKTVNIFIDGNLRFLGSYSINEKMNTLTLNAKKINFYPQIAELFNKEFLDKNDLLETVNTIEFKTKFITKMFGEELFEFEAADPKLLEKSPEAFLEEINSRIFYKIYLDNVLKSKNQGDDFYYSKGTDYEKLLIDAELEVNKEATEADVKKELEQMKSEVKDVFNKVDSELAILTSILENMLEKPFIFDYKTNDSFISLSMPSVHTPVLDILKTAVITQQTHFDISNGLLILSDTPTEKVNPSNRLYKLSETGIKKDSGKVDFVNLKNSKDKISAKYKITRNNEYILVHYQFTSGILKGIEQDASIQVSNELLKEESDE